MNSWKYSRTSRTHLFNNPNNDHPFLCCFSLANIHFLITVLDYYFLLVSCFQTPMLANAFNSELFLSVLRQILEHIDPTTLSSFIALFFSLLTMSSMHSNSHLSGALVSCNCVFQRRTPWSSKRFVRKMKVNDRQITGKLLK